jgi:acetyl-CoA carboxylase carboxyl transferase subunit beta
MNWLNNFIRPKIRSLVTQQKDVPDNLWQKCATCEGMLFNRDLSENLNVCYHCGHHMKITVDERLRLLFDDAKWDEVRLAKVAQDPLKFKDSKKYADRLKAAQTKSRRDDGIIVAKGTITGIPVVIAAFDFDFMGGSMGAGVGEGVVRAAEEAVKTNSALLAIPASGGARMQEGALSLMQMPRTIIAVEMVKEAGLPYFVLLTDPTTGGVSASFAMVGDIHLAEPGCMIGFAGKRVIQETIREELPPRFQTAEYLVDHGMVDMVVPRKELRATLGRMLGLILRPGFDAHGTGRSNKGGSAPKSPAKGGSDVRTAANAARNIAQLAPKLATVKKKKPANTSTPVRKAAAK